jgi:hypothetical protein
MSRRHRLWEMNPETILEKVLAAAAGKRKRGDPITLGQIEAMRRGRDRKAAQRRAAAMLRLKARAAERTGKYPSSANVPGDNRRGWKRGRRDGKLTITDRLLLAMRPGEWHAAYDIVRAVGAGREASGKLSQVMLARGWVTRAANPAWDPHAARRGVASEPKRLYRLTEAGEEYAKGLLSRSLQEAH